MKLIKPSYQILDQPTGLDGIYQQIEMAGRTCYRSQRPEDQTAKDFVDRMIASQHYAMLEHGTVYLIERWKDTPFNMNVRSKYDGNPYTKINTIRMEEVNETWRYITTNFRVLVENGWLDDLKYLCEPTEHHEKRVTVRFTSNIHFYKDITRHRRMSYAIESTRYCNYSKNKFNNELTFIAPVWSNLREGTISYFMNGRPMLDSLGYTDDGTIIKDNYSEAEKDFIYALQIAENMYLNSIIHGWQPQQAAEILPQATKADIVCTGFVSDWNWIFQLRTSYIAATGKPHPEVSRLMDPLYKEFIQRNLIINK